jgi:hypothetical protein
MLNVIPEILSTSVEKLLRRKRPAGLTVGQTGAHATISFYAPYKESE